MKKQFLLQLILCCITAMPAMAYDFEKDGIYYNIVSNEAPYEVKVTYKNCPGNYSGDIIIPATVVNGNTYTVVGIGFQAFACCGEELTSVSIPNTVIHIEEGAFWAAGITEAIIPNAKAVIEEDAFGACTNLVKMYGPASMLDIEENDCIIDKASDIQITGGIISEYGFKFLNNQRKVLTTLDLSNIDNTSIADEAFFECYKLQSIVLPPKLETLGYKSFAECVALKTINIPASVTEIGDRCFEDCRSMTSLTFGSQTKSTKAAEASALKKIGNWSFYNCHEIKSLDIPEGVEEIGLAAFYGCTYLDNLTLPSSTKSVMDNCFAKCENLSQIKCAAAEPPVIDEKTFYDVDRQIPVYVPLASVDAYKDDPNWGEMNIQGTTAVNETGAEPSWKSSIQVTDGAISVAGVSSDIVKVFNLAGQAVANSALTSGIYIVAIGGESVKVAVK